MIGRIINPTTNASSPVLSPWQVVRENKGNFASVSLMEGTFETFYGCIRTEVVLLTNTGFQLRFLSRIPRETLEVKLSEYVYD